MIDLKCKCTTCRFNTNSNCRANNINIDSQTTCNSYIETRSKDAEFADEISQPLVRKSTNVECFANCMFMREGSCIANGITIGNLTNNAKCETFLPD